MFGEGIKTTQSLFRLSSTIDLLEYRESLTSYIVMPKAYTSLAVVGLSPVIKSSGLVQRNGPGPGDDFFVPNITRDVEPHRKSAIPSPETKILFVLTSPCTRPSEWR